MNRIKSKNSGYILVFLVIIIAVILTIGGVIFTIATMNYKMKIVNSQAEKAFYLAEAGAEEAYVICKEYVRSAIEYSKSKVEEFEEDAEESRYEDLNEVFRIYFLDYIKGDNQHSTTYTGLVNAINDNNSYLIYKDGYPIINANIKEKSNYFTVEIKSAYRYEQIEKNAILELKINIPYYSDDFNMSSLIEIINWRNEE